MVVDLAPGHRSLSRNTTAQIDRDSSGEHGTTTALPLPDRPAVLAAADCATGQCDSAGLPDAEPDHYDHGENASPFVVSASEGVGQPATELAEPTATREPEGLLPA